MDLTTAWTETEEDEDDDDGRGGADEDEDDDGSSLTTNSTSWMDDSGVDDAEAGGDRRRTALVVAFASPVLMGLDATIIVTRPCARELGGGKERAVLSSARSEGFYQSLLSHY